MFKNKLKGIALASSLFLAINLTACATTYISKHKISNTVFKELKKPKNKYAILVLGAFPNKKMLDKNVQERALKVYDNLKELGFSDDNIYFLANHRADKEMDKSDEFFTNYGMRKVCSELSDKMTEDDLLIFCYIGHSKEADYGNYALLKNIYEPDNPSLETNDFYIAELEKELNKLKYNHAIMIFDSCYSGKFAKELKKDNRVIISTACDHQTTWVYSQFTTILTEALNGNKEADKNGDNRVSLEEAVNYAAEKDPWSKKKKGLKALFPEPQMYYEEVDPSQVFLKE